MGKFYDSISPELSSWALAQSVFFTASAPTSGKHINVSPKGLPSSSLAILSPNQVAYVDATGSGNETISHIYENGRVTIMFCSFDTAPRIMRFFCQGRVVEWDDREFEPWLAKMGGKKVLGARAVIVLDVFKVQTSCGFGVPRLVKITGSASRDEENKEGTVEYGFESRETMSLWATKKIDKNALFEYQQNNNYDSLDGLTGLKSARRDRGETMLVTDARSWMRKIWGQKDAMLVGFLLANLIYVVALAVQQFR